MITTQPSKPSTHWPNGFEQSRLEWLSKLEVYLLAQRIEESCTKLFALHPRTEPSVPTVSMDINALNLAYAAVNDAARLQEFLAPQQTAKKKTKQIYNERAQYLVHLLAGLELSAILDKKLRNTLEHYAEYIDDANFLHTSNKPSTLYHVAFNMVSTHIYPVAETIGPFPCYRLEPSFPPMYLTRVYCSSTSRLYNFSFSTDLSAIAAQAAEIRIRMLKVLGEGKPEDWCSGLISIGPET
jgi:hypothetical protein